MGRKIKPGPAPVWELPHGKGQGPRPGIHTLPPLKAKSPYSRKGPAQA